MTTPRPSSESRSPDYRCKIEEEVTYKVSYTTRGHYPKGSFVLLLFQTMYRVKYITFRSYYFRRIQYGGVPLRSLLSV